MTEPQPVRDADWYQQQAANYAARTRAEVKADGPTAPVLAAAANAYAQIAISMRLAELLAVLGK
jgi:hypothetical protein